MNEVADLALRPRLRGWSHVVGFGAATVLGATLVTAADRAMVRVVIIIYVLGITAMLGISALYHRRSWSSIGRARIARLDHSAIFAAIAGTYTAVAGLGLTGAYRTATLAVVWAGALAGAAVPWTGLRPARWASTTVYVVIGWTAIAVVPQLWTGLGPLGFSLVLGGGAAYTVGAVVYGLRRPDPWPATFGFHEVFHGLTLVGVGLHLAAIGLVVLPSA